MKILLLGAALLFATMASAQQPAQSPVGPPPQETPTPSTPQERHPNQMPPDTHAPATPALSNFEVQQQLEKKIAEEPGLTGSNVAVTVDDHGIVLSGTVESEQQHQLALRAAQSLAGDRPIDDKLQVRSKA
jgi:osmotically-inducible protein OsmY